jgi:hypothetical protein
MTMSFFLPPAPIVRSILVCFTTLMVWYVCAAAPATYLLDSPELVATTVALGISHPPGHPAFHLLSWPFVLLPLGSATFRVHLACATFAAATCALIPAIAWRSGWLTLRRDVHLVTLIAIGAGLTQAFLFQAIRAEVYSLSALCSVAAWLAVCAPGRPQPRDWILAATALGIGLLNHHYLILFTFPAFALRLILTADRTTWMRSLPLACLTGAGTLAGYLYLVARGFAQAVPAWIWPTDAADLWWLVSAQAFQKTAARAANVDPVAGTLSAMQLMAESMSWPWIFLAFAGLGLLLNRQWKLALPLLALIVFNLVTQIIFDFDAENPDVLGYFMPATIGFALLVAASLTLGLRVLPPQADRPALLYLLASLALLLGLLVPSATGRTRSLHDYYDADLLSAHALGAPPDATLITGYFETAFVLWSARAVADERPDIHHLHRSWRTYPHYDAMVATLEPQLVALLDERPEIGGLSVPALLQRAAIAPVLIEAEAFSTPEEGAISRPVGLWWQVIPSDQRPPLDARALEHHTQAMLQSASVPTDAQLHRNLLWAAWQSARLACRTDPAACPEFVGAGRPLAPNDPMWLELSPGSAPP